MASACLIANSVNIARRKRREMLRPEHGFTVGCTCGNELCFEPEHLEVRRWKCFGGKFADLMERISALAIDESIELPDEKNSTSFRANLASVAQRTHFIVRSLPSGGVRIVRTGTWGGEMTEKEYPVLVHKQAAPCNSLRPGAFFLGFVEFASLHVKDVPKYQHCKAKGCAFPANGNNQGLCRHHFHFFDYSVSRLGRNLDMEDIYGDDKSAPLFYVTWFWKHQGERLKFEQGGKTSWWQERVKLVTESMTATSRPDVTSNVQMPSGRRIFKGWGKRKIRKSQRKREAGWHGPRPKHDVVKRWSRESITESLPVWTPADKPSCAELERQADEILNAAHFFDETPLATPVSYQVMEPDLDEEQEREFAIAELMQRQEEFEEIFS